MILEEVPLFSTIFSQRAIRRFSDSPVSDSVVEKIIDAAIHAPSGSNQQPWSFIVIRNSDIKRQIGQWYRGGWEQYAARIQVDRHNTHMYKSAKYLAETLGEVPVLILVCMDRGARGPGPGPLTMGSSIYPAVQNLLLAATGLGLGTTLTTFHTRHEEDIKTLLSIPESVETAALIPLGYPGEGEKFGGSKRKNASDFVFYDSWGSPRQ